MVNSAGLIFKWFWQQFLSVSEIDMLFSASKIRKIFHNYILQPEMFVLLSRNTDQRLKLK